MLKDKRLSYRWINGRIFVSLPDHPDVFFYTNQGNAPFIIGVDDGENLLETREAFSLLGEIIHSKLVIAFSMELEIINNLYT